jgi:MFS family permease
LGARQALITFSLINLLNYADRYVPSAVKTLIMADLHLNDFESSLPATGLVIVYMFAALVFGMLSDREYIDRRYLLSGAIIFWSLATSLAGLAQNLAALVLLRALVGVGEAAYTTITPPMLFDFYPHQDRAVVMGIFYLAVPLVCGCLRCLASFFLSSTKLGFTLLYTPLLSTALFCGLLLLSAVFNCLLLCPALFYSILLSTTVLLSYTVHRCF